MSCLSKRGKIPSLWCVGCCKKKKKINLSFFFFLPFNVTLLIIDPCVFTNLNACTVGQCKALPRCLCLTPPPNGRLTILRDDRLDVLASDQCLIKDNGSGQVLTQLFLEWYLSRWTLLSVHLRLHLYLFDGRFYLNWRTINGDATLFFTCYHYCVFVWWQLFCSGIITGDWLCCFDWWSAGDISS